MPDRAVRFLYLTDSHLKADELVGYRVHPRLSVEDHACLLSGLRDWLRRKQIDFVVHGGDLTDHGTADEIGDAVRACGHWGVPVYLCLGNHDLAQPNSMSLWLDGGASLLDMPNRGTFGLRFEHFGVFVVAHHWHAEVDHHWTRALPGQARLDEAQLAALDAFLAERDQPVIAVTHAQVCAVGSEQTGQTEPWHPPDAAYAATWAAIARRRPNLRLILSGHNHASSAAEFNGLLACTTAAAGEVPAQARVITVERDWIELQTVSLTTEFGLRSDLTPGYEWAAAPTPGALRISSRGTLSKRTFHSSNLPWHKEKCVIR